MQYYRFKGGAGGNAGVRALMQRVMGLYGGWLEEKGVVRLVCA